MDARHASRSQSPAGAAPAQDGGSPVKKALVEIRRLHRELEAERTRHRQPIALIGMGMRFPGGVASLADLERALAEGRDATGPVPRDRWSHEEFYEPGAPTPGKYYVDRGGFLGGADLFDPEFFGIAPLEANTLDPQQRILLETVWEAVEDAGVPATDLRGSRTGVFLGIGTTDYHRRVLAEPDAIDTYASTGTAFSVASGRIAYLLDLRGPALSIDTACSSSLVAVHLACQSLRSGESDLALAGGVSLILSPEITINFCQAGMLSADGRCKTFDAAADGYVRSEGCGVVLMKRLDDALRDGDRVLGVVAGSAVNQDGRSSGLTAPNGRAQEAVIRAALASAGLDPGDVGYVEAHGTGTSLGDPIEVRALGAVYSAAPREAPLMIGSVKTNFGHLEAAAGLAGLMKAALVLRDGIVPPHLHFRTPNPHIPWGELQLRVPTAPTPLPETNGARRAAVSSFGFSGTNAHVVLEAPPDPAPRPVGEDGAAGPMPAERPQHVLALSAPDRTALKALAARWVAHLEDSSDDFPDMCFTANAGRMHFDRRIAVVAKDAAEARDALRAWLEGRDAPGLFVEGEPGPPEGATAFLFPASASDLSSLMSTSTVVKRTYERWDAGTRRVLGTALLSADASPAQHRHTLDVLRVAAHQHALAELWMSAGIRPDVVLSEGAGHLAAAVVSGIMDVGGAVSAAALDGAGETGGSAAAAEDSKSRRVRYLFRRTDGPPAVATDAASWRALAAAGTGSVDVEPVFSSEGVGRAVILGPRPRSESGAVHVSAPRSGATEWHDVLTALAGVYVSGADVDWRGVEHGRSRMKVSLPRYPFQRRRFWIEQATRPGTAGPAADRHSGAPGTARPVEADPWAPVAAAALERACLAPVDLNLSSYPEKWAALSELNTAVGRNALVATGAFDRADGTVTVDDLVASHGVGALYRRVVERWMVALEREGLLVRADHGWTSPRPLEAVDPAPIWLRVERALADNPALLAYVRNAADKAADVVRGCVSPLETLFPGGSFDLASTLYESASQLRYVNGIAAAALRAFVEGLSADAPVRVLEVGAGTGGTTSSLLPVLPAGRTTYDYTDVSDIFLDWGREKFSSVPFLGTRRFDLERDPREQGVQVGGYDVLVGSNVFHAVRDLRGTLERARSLLAPGGMLLLVESTGHLPWHDMTTGLIEGWQHYDDDDVRDETPLLPVDAWRALLAGAGFRASIAAPPADSPAAVLEQHVILAVNEGRAGADDLAPERAGGTVATAGVRAGAPVPAASSDRGGTELPDLLAGAIGKEREELVAEAVRACVMDVLRSDPDRPPSKDARLMELGLDSLMAVRLRNELQSRLGVKGLPSTLVFDYPTVRHIAALVLRTMDGSQPVAGAPDRKTATPAREADRRREVAALSDEEVEARLLARLERGDL